MDRLKGKMLITLEGAILAGKLAAKVVADRSKGLGSEASLGDAIDMLLKETLSSLKFKQQQNCLMNVYIMSSVVRGRS